MAIITLTTDFGTADGYVGAMKGVIAARAGAQATIVDIAHEIPPGDIPHAAWVVATACPTFPSGTIHVVVVDPGVGGAREEVVVQTATGWYVGPDNGVFGYVAGEGAEARRIMSRRFRNPSVSRTFHGRDVFAPAAAMLACGETFVAVGPVIRLAGALPWGARPAGEGRIVHIDRYGNLISDLPPDEAGEAIAIAGNPLVVRRTFSDVATGELLAYVGSAGTIEIAVRDGRADRRLGVARGERVVPAIAGGPFR